VRCGGFFVDNALRYNFPAKEKALVMRSKPFATLILVTVLACSHLAQAAPEPVNPHATPEARALLAFLSSISGKATITGQHNYPNVGSRWTDLAYDLTGKYPGLFGQDFGFSAGDDKDSVLSRPAMVEEVSGSTRTERSSRSPGTR